MVAHPRTPAGPGRPGELSGRHGGYRPLNEPVPTAVEASPGGLPLAILWRGLYRRVGAIHDTWRIDDEWWRDEISRRYFLVELEDGRRLTLYRDLCRDLWYAQPYDHPRDAASA
jgi:hypothetical protein